MVTSVPDGACEFESRRRLLSLSIACVEDLRRSGIRPGKGPESFCPDFQVCLPYRGVFVWHVGNDDVVGDANQVVVCRRREAFRMSGPVAAGYAELIITPDLDLVSELAHVNGQAVDDHPMFRHRSWRADPVLQEFRTRFLHWACASPQVDTLQAEELVVNLVGSAINGGASRHRINGATTTRLIRRTKEFLERELSNPVRLTDVARAVGASPAYLTDLFRRVEGVSLHKYLTQLRLARALVELPHTADLTALALGLGFSSHSHFSFTFRRAFGSTPSQFRDHTRRAARPTVPVTVARRHAGLEKRATRRFVQAESGSTNST